MRQHATCSIVRTSAVAISLIGEAAIPFLEIYEYQGFLPNKAKPLILRKNVISAVYWTTKLVFSLLSSPIDSFRCRLGLDECQLC